MEKNKTVSIDPVGQVLERKSYTMVSILIFLYALSFSTAIPAFPATTLIICNHDSAYSSYIYGAGMTIRYVTETIFSPLIGTVSDVAGRRTVLLMSFLVGGLEFLAMGLAPSIEMLFMCRMLTGVGDSGISTAYAIFSDIAIFNKDNLSVTFGRVAATIIVAFVIGPVVGGLISDSYSPSVCLLVSACMTGLAFIASFFLLEETLGFNGVDNSNKMVFLRTGLYPDITSRNCDNQLPNGSATSTNNRNDSNSRSSARDSVVCNNQPYETLHNTMSGIRLGSEGSEGSGSGLSMKEPHVHIHRKVSERSDASSSIPDAEVCRAIYDSDEDDIVSKQVLQEQNEAYLQSQIGCLRCCPGFIARRPGLQWLTRFFIISNPFPSIIFHFSKPKMRQLLIPVFISNLVTGGLISIWYIYLDFMFSATSLEVGYYLSAMALTTTFVMGYFLRLVVPDYIPEKKAITYGYVVASLQFVVLGGATKYGYLFISLIFLAGTIADPTLLGMLVKQSMVGETVLESSSRQGNLQGTISSVKTFASAFGSIIFSRLLSAGVNMSPAKPWIPFALAFVLFNICAVYIGCVFSTKAWKNKRNTGSRLSRDVPEDRPMTEEDFEEQAEAIIGAGSLPVIDDSNDAEAPLLN